MHNRDLEELYRIIGYSFKDDNLVRTAMLHPSAANLTGRKGDSFERMEYLGDSILDFIISEYLYKKHTQANEGELSRMQSMLVSRKTCAIIGKKIRIADFIIFSPGAEKNNERSEDANISNAVESLIAAIYLDGGIEEVRSFVMSFWGDLLLDVKDMNIDYKSKLQSISQNIYKILPKYEVIEISGSDHDPSFTTQVIINKMRATGIGKNKKDSEQMAASHMLKLLSSNIST